MGESRVFLGLLREKLEGSDFIELSFSVFIVVYGLGEEGSSWLSDFADRWR